ncbi:HERC4 [Cordylochernes scorpioides]|uniref:HERC4 n=1 Tax=Cordylochernes scorpioides TaxID=51811 RepID=A0ABY6LJP3_9ARAC|nr:HERC4 [Cordylochernes scorpioides]
MIIKLNVCRNSSCFFSQKSWTQSLGCLRNSLKPDVSGSDLRELVQSDILTANDVQSFEEDMMFYLIGIICGLAIYNFTIINLPFPLVLYKKLLNE